MPLGAAAMAYALWSRHLSFNPTDPHWFNRDRFVLSAGHGSMLLYALLYLTGYDLTLDDLKNFRQLGSKTPGHPEVGHTPGVEATTGPLGQGLGNAVGMAIAEAHLRATYNTGGAEIVDHFTYALCGDGDLMEGISQEAISLAGHLKLGKLIVLYDDNLVSLAGPTDVTFTDDVCGRFEASGWHTQFVDVSHANDVDAIDQAIAVAKNVTDRPSMIAVRTHIGFGSPLQDTFKAHGEPLGPENVKKTKEALGWPSEPDFYVPDDVLKFYRDLGRKGAGAQAQWQQGFDKWQSANGNLAKQLLRALDGKLPANLPWPEFTAENGSVATRDAGGTVMNAIAAALPELVGGSADLDPSTKTYLKGQGDFEPDGYAGRNIHYGVREHVMAAASNGIALHGGLHAVLRDVLQLRRLHEARAASGRAQRAARNLCLHARFRLSRRRRADSRADRAARDASRDSERQRRPAGRCARNARGLETRDRSAQRLPVGARPNASKGPVPRQAQRRRRTKARTSSLIRDGTPDLIAASRPAPKSRSRSTPKRFSKGKACETRVVSMPCWELFEQQDREYNDDSASAQRHRAHVHRSRRNVRLGTMGRAIAAIAFGIDHFGTVGAGSGDRQSLRLYARTTSRKLALEKFASRQLAIRR